MNRKEHLQWSKDRALAYVDAGDINQAFASFASDLGKHDETEAARKLAATLGMPMLMMGALSTPDEMRKFINGFN